MLQQQQLLNKLVNNNKSNSPKDVKQILKSAKKGFGGLVDLIYEYARIALAKFNPQIQTPLYLEQLCHSAIDLHDAKTAEVGLSKLKQYYGITLPLARIKARILEIKQYNGQNVEAAETYINTVLANDLSDPEARKILVNIKYAEQTDQYIQQLNTFVKDFPSDTQGWQQLGSLYNSTLNYHKAIYCYEQLLLLNPNNTHYYVRLAQLLYTQGGSTNLKNAKDYLCFVVSKDKNSYRALWVLNKVLKTLITEKGQDGPVLNELYETTKKLLVEFYSKRKSNIKITLDKYKF